jgi:hypothetical protein
VVLKGIQVEACTLNKEMAKKSEKEASGKIRIQYYRSTIGYSKKQKEIVKSLGITKLNQTIERI